MEIEKGKRYKLRDGSTAKCFKVTLHDVDASFVYHMRTVKRHTLVFTVNKDGVCLAHDARFDITGEIG